MRCAAIVSEKSFAVKALCSDGYVVNGFSRLSPETDVRQGYRGNNIVDRLTGDGNLRPAEVHLSRNQAGVHIQEPRFFGSAQLRSVLGKLH